MATLPPALPSNSGVPLRVDLWVQRGANYQDFETTRLFDFLGGHSLRQMRLKLLDNLNVICV
jgi:hypothetical protein